MITIDVINPMRDNRQRGQAKLLDFGLAKQSDLESKDTEMPTASTPQMDNIFAIQDEITSSVANALRATLQGEQIAKAQETNPEA